MTRDEVLAQYRPIRAGIQRVLKIAPQACTKTDFRRALEEIAPWADDADLDGEAIDMMVDTALFTPGRRGQRRIDQVGKKLGRKLEMEDQALLAQMQGAWFSLFRVAEKHEVAGLWLEDILQGDRRIWLVDEALEASATIDVILGLRLFDAGPFHAGFGIIVEPSDMALGTCLAAQARRVPLTVASSVAALVYQDHLVVETPVSDEELELIESFATFLGAELDSEIDGVIEHEETPRRRKASPRLPLPKR